MKASLLLIKLYLFLAKMLLMRNILILILPILLFSNGTCEDQEDKIVESPVSNPLDSKEEILAYFQSEHDGLDESDICIVEVEEFENLFVYGYFAHDRGCAVNGMFFKGQELPGDHSKAYLIMNENKFSNNAEQLVENYHIKVINTFKTVVWETNEDFDEGEHSKPNTDVKDGKITSTLWIQRPSGMIKERSYYLSTLIFDKKGNFVSLEQSNQFSIAY